MKKLKNRKSVCVITGGGSGIGLATAKEIGKNHHIIIVGRTVQKLENALEILKKNSLEAESFACDISDLQSVEKLAKYANEIGSIKSVIHSAGLSPHMGDAETIMKANALGTININSAFYEVMEESSCMINISSMSGYFLPNIILPIKGYQFSKINKDKFLKKMMNRVNLFPAKLRSSIAYGISKNFVIWYVKANAVKFGEKGIRILSVSPGSFETPMGEIEKEGIDGYISKSAIKRLGKVEEISSLLGFLASEEPSYLTGTDILCDGGCVASRMK